MNEVVSLIQNYAVLTQALLPNLMWSSLTANNDPLLKLYPLGYEDADVIRYDQWQDPFGLVALRGIDGPPPIITLPGIRVYQVAPGYYGNKSMIRESQIVKMREPGTANLPVELGKLMSYYMNYFITIVAWRVRQTIADLLINGTFTNTTTNATDNTSNGSIQHTYTIDNYRTLSPANDANTGPSWNLDPVNAKPIQDLQFWQNELQLGTSTSFGNDSTLVTQQSVINDLLKTTQIQQTYRDNYGASIPGFDGLNKFLQGFGLPQIEIYNEGYNPTLADVQNQDLSAFTRFIPPGSLIWAGKRKEGQMVGQFLLTRSANKVISGMPGYPEAKVNAPDAELPFSQGIYVAVYVKNQMPVEIDYEIGFNAAPASYYWAATAGITYPVAS